ncbi:hypothetical protein [Desulfuribacillus alkaliarsenatis]|uniref:Uncharacterized protein n=1 Tax=Desulfuribacillus alkaliarsenatis TaxID=766136 RepID=A0A1E5FZ73_9FIRM|nr:hypothetical protein [Desulfuribacillus alkaliarsenatis]OEF95871.1 hypothetical protein BHF68_10780 [Desulfuribacillus alkaliarsenatis]
MCKNPFFADANQTICGACKEKDKEQKYLEQVLKYLKEHPKSPVAVVINETGIPYDMLKKFIKEKRVDLVLDQQYEEQMKREKQRLYNELANAKDSLVGQNKLNTEKKKGKDNLSYQTIMKDRRTL